jgi:PAS domain S-box-containing protein
MFSDENLRRVLFDASSDCVLILDEEGRALMVNETCRRLMESVGAPDLVGDLWVERWPAEARKNVSEALSSARAGETVRFRESCHGTSSQKWWDVCVAPIRTESGGAMRLLCVCRDITDTRRAQQEALESEARLQLGCATAGLALASMDFKQGLAFLSVESARLLGLGNEATTLSLNELPSLVHPDDRDRVMEAIAMSLRPDGPGWFELDLRIVRPSGEVRWHRARQQVIFEGEGAERRASHAILASFDITKQKAAEETLQRNKEFLRAMLDSLPHHVAVIGEDGRIIAVNKPWDRFARANGGAPDSVGLGVDYLASARIAAMEGDVFASRAFEGINSVLTGSRDKFILEYPCHAPDREQWFMLHAMRLSWPPAAVILSHTDITERIRNEQRLREAEERLRESDRNKDEFIATLAHELRNPLAPLRSGLQFMRRVRPGEPGFARMQDIMERQVAHLVRLVDDLLDISRISRGKVELRKERIDAVAIVRQAIADVRALMEAKNLAIHMRGFDAPMPMVGDPVRVSQIIVNLLDNAIKYSDGGGTIRLAAQRNGMEICIAISDTGAGISPDMLPMIFDLFTQGEGTPKQGRAGLGIGLALVRKLVEMHGGSVEAQSDGLGHGARFLVRFPLAEGVSQAAGVDAADLQPIGVGGRRALIIDDNRDAADSLAIALSHCGFEVDVAYSGMEGLARAAAFTPDLVLLDLGMPVMDGYQTARALRAQPGGAEIELVALTGWGEEEARRRVKEAGFDGHLIKPARIEDIAALFPSGQPVTASE